MRACIFAMESTRRIYRSAHQDGDFTRKNTVVLYYPHSEQDRKRPDFKDKLSYAIRIIIKKNYDARHERTSYAIKVSFIKWDDELGCIIFRRIWEMQEIYVSLVIETFVQSPSLQSYINFPLTASVRVIQHWLRKKGGKNEGRKYPLFKVFNTFILPEQIEEPDLYAKTWN